MVHYAWIALLAVLFSRETAGLLEAGRGVGYRRSGGLRHAADWGSVASRVHQMQQEQRSQDDTDSEQLTKADIGFGQTPGREKPCCYPPTWQGYMYRYESMDDLEYFVTFYEDDPTQRLALDIVVTPGSSNTSTKISQIVQTDVANKKVYLYEFDKAAKVCRRAEFDNMTYAEVTESCIPADAFYAGEFSIGIPKGGASLALRSWMWNPVPAQMPNLRLERLVTPDCAPAMRVLRNLDEDAPILEADYYFNVQTSIADPSVFTLPDYCKQNGRGGVAKRSVGNAGGMYLDVIGSGILSRRVKN